MSEFAAYAAAGWKLCAIERGGKAPLYAGWNENPIGHEALDAGAGLLHALSGTCAVDVDNLQAATAWLEARGVDLAALLNAQDAVRVESGRPGRTKLLYRLKRPLRTYRPQGSGLELRCATAAGKSVQDVLPPSVHPKTNKPYRWVYPEPLIGHWSALPPLPANLLAVWRSLGDTDLSAVSAPATDAPPTAAPVAPAVDLEALRKATFRHSPDAPYDEWLKVGMQLHDGTRGAREGLEIWREWSRGVKRIPYPGDQQLRIHWASFETKPGKRVASGAQLVREAPAEADEFPVEPLDSAPVPEGETKEGKRKAAVSQLEARLVYVIGQERYFDTERYRLIGSDNALEHMFTYLMPRKNGNRISPVKMLKESATKRIADEIGFHPGEKVIYRAESENMTYVNTFKPLNIEPLEPTAAERERVDFLFNRITDETYRKWLMQFYGYVVQHPATKIKSAPLIWSEKQGNGKTTLLRQIPSRLVGQRYSKEVTFSSLNSDFNDYLLNGWHINLTEFRAGTRGEREAVSKKVENWIADDMIAVNPKGKAGYTMPNHVFITASSNKEDAASIDENDRKWAVYRLDAPPFTEAEQDWMYSFLMHPRAAGVLRHIFAHVDLTGFSPHARAIATQAKDDMVGMSQAGDAELIASLYEEKADPLHTDVVRSRDVVEWFWKHTPYRPSLDRVTKLLVQRGGLLRRFNDLRVVILRNHNIWLNASRPALLAEIDGSTIDTN